VKGLQKRERVRRNCTKGNLKIMPWLYGLGVLLWFAGWIGFGSRYTASKAGDKLVGACGGLALAFAATTSLAVFVAIPVRSMRFLLVTLWIHHAAFWSLFAFLAVAEFFQIEAWWRIRQGRSTPTVSAAYHRLWILTEIVPAPIAVTIFLTGLRLIWELPERNSPSSVWLFGLVLGFGFFFFDGIFGYTPIVAGFHDHWRRATENSAPVAIAAQEYRRPLERAQLFVHFLSWPFVFLLGLSGWNPPNPITACIASFERWLGFLPRGWAPVTVAVILWASMGTAVIAIRKLPRALHRGMASGKSTPESR
jgi:hypothetical protein